MKNMALIALVLIMGTGFASTAEACKKTAIGSQIDNFQLALEEVRQGMSTEKQQATSIQMIYRDKALVVVELIDAKGACQAMSYEIRAIEGGGCKAEALASKRKIPCRL